MFTTDWFLLGILLISLLLGALRGLVYEVISVLGWIAAFVLAQWFAPEVAERLSMQGSSQAFRYAAAFVLIFVLSVFASGLLSALVRKVISAVGLRPVDRILGAVFGLFRGLILLLALTVVIHMTSMSQSDWWQESRGRPLLSTLIKGLKPMLPVKFGAFLPDGLD